MVWTGCISAYDKMGSHPPVPCVEFSLPRCWAQFSTWSCITCIMMYPVICVRIDPWMTFFDHLNDLLSCMCKLLIYHFMICCYLPCLIHSEILIVDISISFVFVFIGCTRTWIANCHTSLNLTYSFLLHCSIW